MTHRLIIKQTVNGVIRYRLGYSDPDDSILYDTIAEDIDPSNIPAFTVDFGCRLVEIVDVKPN